MGNNITASIKFYSSKIVSLLQPQRCILECKLEQKNQSNQYFKRSPLTTVQSRQRFVKDLESSRRSSLLIAFRIFSSRSLTSYIESGRGLDNPTVDH